MNRLWIALLFVLSFATFCLAAEKVEAPDSCKHCGMDRTKFAHSRMIVTYTDGSSIGTCSINCVATEVRETKKVIKYFQVGDYNTKKLTDAKTATWVIGGSKKGVMTKVAKWAFAERTDAETFIKANGGKPATFDEALKASENEQTDQGQNKKSHDHKGH